ncbi:MAG: sugar ABC transporter permease [Bacilli bacterium]|nr:sugar ABC transporter permease [Bacilli bacterium]
MKSEAIKNEKLLPLVPNTKNKSGHLSRRTSEIIFVCLMLSLPVIQFIIFWIVPNFKSILLGFQDARGGFSTQQFTEFFSLFQKDPISGEFSAKSVELFTAVGNSLIYFAVNIFICTPIVVFFSYVLFRKVPLHGVFKIIFYLPSIIGGTVMATIYYQLFNNSGPLFQLLKDWGWISEKVAMLTLFESPETGFLMILIYSIWTCVGINMIMFYGAMKRIPNEIFESASIDGVGFFRQFINLVVPLIWPTITTLIIFSLAGIFVTYGPVMILAPNNRNATMIGWYIFSRVDNGELNYPAAVGLLFTAIGLPFVMFVRWLLNKIGSNTEY